MGLGYAVGWDGRSLVKYSNKDCCQSLETPSSRLIVKVFAEISCFLLIKNILLLLLAIKLDVQNSDSPLTIRQTEMLRLNSVVSNSPNAGKGFTKDL